MTPGANCRNGIAQANEKCKFDLKYTSLLIKNGTLKDDFIFDFELKFSYDQCIKYTIPNAPLPSKNVGNTPCPPFEEFRRRVCD